LPFRRKTASGWVPGGTATLAEPSSVGTFTVVPRTASVTDRVSSRSKFAPPARMAHRAGSAPPQTNHLALPLDRGWAFLCRECAAPNLLRHPPESASPASLPAPLRHFATSPLRHFATALALRAGMLEFAATTMAIRAGGNLLDQNLLFVVPPTVGNASRARAGLTLGRRGPPALARAMAGRAGGRTRQADFFLAPAGYPLQ
jgi:hypothetical protein